jgi:methylmalonyl-CoA mutase, C-terminal domain
VIGISVLSGAHLALSKELLAERTAQHLDDVAVVVGGTIPAADAVELREAGVAAVLPVGTSLDRAVETVLSLAQGRR